MSGTLGDVIEVRVLTPDDWPNWRALRLAALAGAPAAFSAQLAGWQGEGDREERWRARLSIPGSPNLLAVLHAQPPRVGHGKAPHPSQ